MSVTYEQNGAVVVLTLDRPQSRNALTVEMREQIVEAARRISEDDSVRAVVLTGAGGAFCAGVEASGMGGRGPAASRSRLRGLQQSVLALHGLEKPVVAAVAGACVGVGWSLAMACDQVVAADTAFFSQVFGRMGLAPDGGSAWFLARHVGLLRAKDLVYSCRRMPAGEALEWGLVNTVCSEADLRERAMALAQKLAEGPTMAIGLSGRLLDAAVGPSLETFLETELLVQSQLTQSDDYREGVAAFREKRSPRFKGH